jgi:hypothetical protein
MRCRPSDERELQTRHVPGYMGPSRVCSVISLSKATWTTIRWSQPAFDDLGSVDGFLGTSTS